MKLPPGWKVVHVPEDQEFKSGQVAYTFKATTEDDRLTYSCEMTIKNNIIPPEDYVGYKKAIEALKGLADEWIVCRVEDSDVAGEEHARATVQIEEVHHD